MAGVRSPVVQLTGADVRELAQQLQLRPSKRRGQNFVTDPNTVRRIVSLAELTPDDVVLEVGPGLGSLTLGLLSTPAAVIAVELDPLLAEALPDTVGQRAGSLADKLTVITGDALEVTQLPRDPTACVANLPYNVAVPVVLHVLATFPTITRGLVMVQSEVADRLVAKPGSRVYGIPSVKLQWFGNARRVATIAPSVFWPVPRVDSALVQIERTPAPRTTCSRDDVFTVVDLAFAQRRKTLRAALTRWAGSAQESERRLRAAGVAPSARGERLVLADYVAVAEQAPPYDAVIDMPADGSVR